MSPLTWFAIVLLVAYVYAQEEDSLELPHAKLFAYKVREIVNHCISSLTHSLTYTLTYARTCSLIYALTR